jgi:hypothetical protein
MLLFAVQVNVIDLQAFLTSGQEKRLSAVRSETSSCEIIIAVQSYSYMAYHCCSPLSYRICLCYCCCNYCCCR